MDFGALPAPMYHSSRLLPGGVSRRDRAHIDSAVGEIDAHDQRRLVAAAVDHRDIGGLHGRMTDSSRSTTKVARPAASAPAAMAPMRQRMSERRNAAIAKGSACVAQRSRPAPKGASTGNALSMRVPDVAAAAAISPTATLKRREASLPGGDRGLRLGVMREHAGEQRALVGMQRAKHIFRRKNFAFLGHDVCSRHALRASRLR